jgi:hypothetical protein
MPAAGRRTKAIHGQLTPEQEKLWPPVEEAIRARADARYQRMAAVAQRRSQQGEVDPVALLRDRSDALAAKAAALKSSPMRGQSRPEAADAPPRDACPSSIERRVWSHSFGSSNAVRSA